MILGSKEGRGDKRKELHLSDTEQRGGGGVTHAFNSHTWEAETGGSREFQASQGYLRYSVVKSERKKKSGRTAQL